MADSDSAATTSAFDAVNAAVKDKVNTQSTGLRDRVVDTLTKVELDKRADLLLSGLKKVGEMRGETRKLAKPTSVNQKLVDGKFVKEEVFTTEAVKKIDEHAKKLAKLEAALSKAMDKADYEDLKKAVGGGGSDKGADSGEEKKDEAAAE